jgi:hypothetical protein
MVWLKRRFGAKESSRRGPGYGCGDGKPTELNYFAAARLGNFRFADDNTEIGGLTGRGAESSVP